MDEALHAGESLVGEGEMFLALAAGELSGSRGQIRALVTLRGQHAPVISSMIVSIEWSRWGGERTQIFAATPKDILRLPSRPSMDPER